MNNQNEQLSQDMQNNINRADCGHGTDSQSGADRMQSCDCQDESGCGHGTDSQSVADRMQSCNCQDESGCGHGTDYPGGADRMQSCDCQSPICSGGKDPRIVFDPDSLRQLRLDCNLTLENAASLAGINKMTLQRYERSDIHSMAASRLSSLAAVYHTVPARLTGIPKDQEYYVRDSGILTPDSAIPPSRLNLRLYACLSFMAGSRCLRANPEYKKDDRSS